MRSRSSLSDCMDAQGAAVACCVLVVILGYEITKQQGADIARQQVLRLLSDMRSSPRRKKAIVPGEVALNGHGTYCTCTGRSY